MNIDYEQIKGISEEKEPLFFHREGELYPDTAFIYMDEYGTISAETREDSGGVRCDLWNNRTLSWKVPENISGKGLLELIENNLSLFKEVHKGHSVEWDGSNNSGQLNDDASNASIKMGEIIYLLDASTYTG